MKKIELEWDNIREVGYSYMLPLFSLWNTINSTHEFFTTKSMSENLILALLVKRNLETENKFCFIVGTHSTLINKK